MLFNEASRGPFGAVQLLVRLHTWHLASLGGIVTLLALFSDVSLQASVTFPPESSDVGVASIPISTKYTLAASTPAGQGVFVENVDPSLKSALYSGMLDDGLQNRSSDLNPECSAGNCTFPHYVSLGICSDCKNFTSRVHRELDLPSGLLYQNDSTLHLRPELGADLLTLLQNWVSGPVGLVNMTKTVRDIPSKSHKPSLMLSLSDTSIITTPCPRQWMKHYRAFECSLILCVKQYQGRVQGGKLTENVSDVVLTGWNATPTMTREN